MGFGIALLKKRVDYTDKLMEVVYNCQMCGACDISCKYAMDMEVLEPLYEVRSQCVKSGHTLPVLDKLVGSLRKQGPMLLGAKAKRKAPARKAAARRGKAASSRRTARKKTSRRPSRKPAARAPRKRSARPTQRPRKR